MATEFTTKSGEVVATRFFGGKDRGVCFQMEVTETEWPAWANEMVAPAGSDAFVRFADAVAGCACEWDNAARQNAAARQFEAHRFAADMPAAFEASAWQARQRARACAKQGMRMAPAAARS